MARTHAIRLPPHVRVTPQRQAVIDVIAASPEAFTALEIYDRVRKDERRLGLATVYRTIELLRRAGAVRPLAGADGTTYVRCRRGHHHHLVCVSCGAVEETTLCAAPSQQELKRRHGFAAQRHEFDVYGTCKHCTAA